MLLQLLVVMNIRMEKKVFLMGIVSGPLSLTKLKIELVMVDRLLSRNKLHLLIYVKSEI